MIGKDRVQPAKARVVEQALIANGRVLSGLEEPALQHYKDIVNIGKDNASNETLGSHVSKMTRLTSLSPQEIKDAQNRALSIRSEALSKYSLGGVNYKLKAVRTGDNEIKIQSASGKHSQVMSLDKFINGTFDDAAMKNVTEDWIVRTIADLKIGVGDHPTINDFVVVSIKNKVKFMIDTVAPAETDLADFQNASKAKLYEQIDKWITAGKPVGTDPFDL